MRSIGAACRLLGLLCWPLTASAAQWMGRAAPYSRPQAVLHGGCALHDAAARGAQGGISRSHLTVATGAWSRAGAGGAIRMWTRSSTCRRASGCAICGQWARAPSRGAVRPAHSCRIGRRSMDCSLRWRAFRAARDWIVAGVASSIRIAYRSRRTIIRCMRRTLYGRVGTAIGAPPLPGQGTEYRPPA